MTTRAGDASEPFELLEELGRGGFATTFRARVLDPELLAEFGVEVVALKIPSSRRHERVLRKEMELNAGLHMRLKRLRSPNIVRYLGFEVLRGQLVMVMEYVPQGSLRGRLGPVGRQRRLPLDESVELAVGILRGLALIHAEQVFHRDIKPENILVVGRTPKLADLGLARLLDSGELAVTQAGTLPYMSPEILSAEGASYSADLWSVGVTLYEMITGQLPFGDGRTPIRKYVELICRSEPTPAVELVPELGARLSQIIERSLRKNPADRFASATEMADALEASAPRASDGLDAELALLRERAANDASSWPAVEERASLLAADKPRDPRPLRLLGEILGRRQRHEDAAAAFRRAAALAPEDAALQWQLALALQSAGDRAGAAVTLRRALELGLDPRLRSHAELLLRTLQGRKPA